VEAILREGERGKGERGRGRRGERERESCAERFPFYV
jgi:hypothetical protein